MLLRATHTTTYLYSEPVSICHTEVHLAPRAHDTQSTVDHELTVHPAPDLSIDREDYFGNPVTYFSIHEPHRTLTITATSTVDRGTGDYPHPSFTPPWEQVRAEVHQHATEHTFQAYEFIFESPRVEVGPEFAAYAAPSFPAGRTLLESALDLCQRIYKDFRYDRHATTVTTPVSEVLRSRGGVCQDFAHLMIACCRSFGLPARYVSGYLRSGPNTVGAEASHAWASVFCSGYGWVDFDPTNDVMPNGNHVTVAWGRDYSDVSPVKGIALGGGEQIITVAVGVVPVPAAD
jgi:transglutaminase-like putative cysteine protease